MLALPGVDPDKILTFSASGFMNVEKEREREYSCNDENTRVCATPTVAQGRI